MQKFTQKKLIFFLAFFSINIQVANCQGVYQRLQAADSLFESKKYAQAYPIYEDLLSKKHQFSNQMLLKMAFIKENSNDIPQALYLLNLYYYSNPSPRVEKKIMELANRHDYAGYYFGELEFLLLLYKRYFEYVLAALLFLCGLTLYNIVRSKLKREPLTYKPLVFIVLLSGVYYLINYGVVNRHGVVTNKYAYLMSAPSAAAPVADVITDGHRLHIHSELDVWYEVTWKDQRAYINKHNVEVIY